LSLIPQKTQKINSSLMKMATPIIKASSIDEDLPTRAIETAN